MRQSYIHAYKHGLIIRTPDCLICIMIIKVLGRALRVSGTPSDLDFSYLRHLHIKSPRDGTSLRFTMQEPTQIYIETFQF